MPIGKDKKSVQGYVKIATKEKIIKLAEEEKKSESHIVGQLLDKALADPPLTLSNFFAKTHEKNK